MAANPLKGCRCACESCLEQFGSVRAFDKHRVGSYASPGTFQHQRRCLSVSEMLATGWATNAKGQWLAPDARRAGADFSGREGREATHVAPIPRSGLLGQHRHLPGASKGA